MSHAHALYIHLNASQTSWLVGHISVVCFRVFIAFGRLSATIPPAQSDTTPYTSISTPSPFPHFRTLVKLEDLTIGE